MKEHACKVSLQTRKVVKNSQFNWQFLKNVKISLKMACCHTLGTPTTASAFQRAGPEAGVPMLISVLT
jgi:hypothetical protein